MRCDCILIGCSAFEQKVFALALISRGYIRPASYAATQHYQPPDVSIEQSYICGMLFLHHLPFNEEMTAPAKPSLVQ